MLFKELLAKGLLMGQSLLLMLVSLYLYTVDSRSELLLYTSNIFLFQLLLAPVPVSTPAQVSKQLSLLPLLAVLAVITVSIYCIVGDFIWLSLATALSLYLNSLVLGYYHSAQDLRYKKVMIFDVVLRYMFFISVVILSGFIQIELVELYFVSQVGHVSLLFFLLAWKHMDLRLLVIDIASLKKIRRDSLPFFQNSTTVVGSLGGYVLTTFGVSTQFSGVFDVLYRLGSIVNAVLIAYIRTAYFQGQSLVKKAFVTGASFVLFTFSAAIIALVFIGDNKYIIGYVAVFFFPVFNALLGVSNTYLRRRDYSVYIIVAAMLVSGIDEVYALLAFTLVSFYIVKRIPSR